MMYSLTLTKRANVVLHESVLNEILTDNHINTGKKINSFKKVFPSTYGSWFLLSKLQMFSNSTKYHVHIYAREVSEDLVIYKQFHWNIPGIHYLLFYCSINIFFKNWFRLVFTTWFYILWDIEVLIIKK